MSFIKETEKYIYDVITKCGYEIDNVSLESSSDATLVNFKLMYVWLLLKSMEKIQENLQMK